MTRVIRSLLLTPVAPLFAIGVVGLGLGYRDVANLASFVFMWAIVVSPIVVLLALGGYLLSRRFHCRQFRHFALGGFLVGSALCGAWFFTPFPSRFAAVLTIAGGTVGAISAALFWLQAVQGSDA